MQKPGLLMVSWYLHPSLSGGIGRMVTESIEALKNEYNITLILPAWDVERPVEGFKIIETDHLLQKEMSATPVQKSAIETGNFFKSYQHFSPYQSFTEPSPLPFGGKEDEFINDAPDQGSMLMQMQKDFNNLVVQIAQTLEYDIIYCHEWITFPAGVKLKLMNKKKLICHVHSLEFDRSETLVHNEAYSIERKGMDVADVVIAPSEYTAKIIKTTYDIFIGKVFVLPNYYAFEPYAREKDPQRLHVVFAGRITVRKGILTYLEIIKKTAGRIPYITFHIAGEGDMIARITKEIAGAEEFIKIHGYCTEHEIKQLFAKADLMICPYHSDPFGLICMEAALAGVPVLFSNTIGLTEHLPSALKIDARDTDGFCLSALTILESETMRKALVEDQIKEIKESGIDQFRNRLREKLEEMV